MDEWREGRIVFRHVGKGRVTRIFGMSVLPKGGLVVGFPWR